jgi:hypothetical protein
MANAQQYLFILELETAYTIWRCSALRLGQKSISKWLYAGTYYTT